MSEEQKEIGEIGNQYGQLEIKKSDDKYYWAIGNYDGYDWEEIPKYLYDSLIKYEDERVK